MARYLVAIVTVAVCLGLTPAAAQVSVTVGGIELGTAWARATVGKNGAAYIKLTNTTDADDKLVAAKTAVAKRAELHTHLMEDGVMKMRPVDDIPLPAGEAVALEPGGLHVMLMGLTAPLQKGKSFMLTLEFEKAGSIGVNVKVAGPGAQHPPH